MSDAYLSAFKGSFTSALRWHQLDALWQAVRKQNDGEWFVYAVGETPPASATSSEQCDRFLSEIDQLLREEHDEEYCGIVYADNLQTPAFIFMIQIILASAVVSVITRLCRAGY
jgi:hypothetical protein